MANEKWTKGPWEYGEDRRGVARVFAGTSEIVRALSTHGNRRLPKAEREANARLIAAAPQLYAALAELDSTLGTRSIASPRERQLMSEVHAALSSARGE